MYDDVVTDADRLSGWRRWILVTGQVVAGAWSLLVLFHLLRWLLKISLDRFFVDGFVAGLDTAVRWTSVPAAVLLVLAMVVGGAEFVLGVVQGATRRGTWWAPPLRAAGLGLFAAGALWAGWRWVDRAFINPPLPERQEPSSVQVLVRSMAVLGGVFVTLVAVALAVLSLGSRRQVLVGSVGQDEDDR